MSSSWIPTDERGSPNLRTARDGQQWILDLALNMRGRVQNFERDEPEVPDGARARNYRMLPKVWRKAADRHSALATAALELGHTPTAINHLDHAIDAYRMAQHPIFFDDHPVKEHLWDRLDDSVNLRSRLAPYSIERIEVPFEGATISCLLHLLPGRGQAPCVLYIPGMDQTKESFPRSVLRNPAHERGMHVVAMDGPGQGSSNRKKLRVHGDNYERAVGAVVHYISNLPEIDAARVGLYGISMGSYWALRAAADLPDIAAVASAVACFNPNNTIFSQSSPRFKQMFMYMAGISDESRFDEIAKKMTVKGHIERITVPTLLVTGEFDPLCPLEDALDAYERLNCDKELWVIEDQYHPLWSLENLGGLDIHEYILDWIGDTFAGSRPSRIAYSTLGGRGPFVADAEWKPPISSSDAYF